MFRAETTSTNERQTEIIAAAIRVLARDGLAETTTRKIAAEANVNQAMLRYYFGSKDELLFAVLQEMMRLTREVVRSVEMTEGSLHEAIVTTLKAFWSHVETSPDFQVIQYELTLYALRNPDSAWLARQQYDGYISIVETLFEEVCARTGTICAIPVGALARFVVAGLDGMILQFVSNHDQTCAQHGLKHLIAAVTALAENITPAL